MGEIVSFPLPGFKRRRRLRFIGAALLVLGIATAGLVYRHGMRYAAVMHDPSMLAFYKAETRQMGEFYGQMGLVFERFIQDLREPGTQARLIVAASMLACAVCFYVASGMEDVEEPDAEPSERRNR